MTREEALEILKNDTVDTSDDWCEAFEMAIASLEAWGKVKAEIDEFTDIFKDGEFYIKNSNVKRIIDRYLQDETDEDNT